MNKSAWKEQDNTLVKEFTLPTFGDAIDFINKVARIAEEMNHHPEIKNIYNKVTLTLSTHDKGNTITDKDIELKNEIEKISL